MQKRKTFRYGYDVGDFLSSAFSGWLFAIVLSLLVNLNAEGGGLSSLLGSASDWMRDPADVGLTVVITLFFTVVYTELIGLCRLGRRIVSTVLLAEYLVFAGLLLSNVEGVGDYPVLFASLAFLVPILLRVVSTYREKDGEEPPAALPAPRGRFAPVLIFGIAVSCLFGGVVAAIGVMRYLGYSAPNFDFGIFCQMFENMAKTGAPVTTVERDGSLSHFAVHTSPILYLLLPFYFVFRTPITLAVGQAVILYSGVIPLLFIARRRGLSNPFLVLLSLCYAAYPAIGTGCFYDFHENCFLLPLLLWTFWFSECRRPIPFFLFAALTLAVKEDAFVYLVIFAVWLLVGEKRWKTALPLIVLSLGYFLLVSHLMKANGEGVMNWRYSNLVPKGEEGLFSVVLTVFTNPGYVLTQIFSTTARNADKFKYVAALILPLAGLPCVTRRPSRWLLLSPLLLNLLTMYVYQPNINFQYSFGIIAFLFFAATLNLADLTRARPFAVGSILFSAAACVLAFSILVFPMIGANADHIEAWKGKHDTITAKLNEIPKDASVAASTFFVPHLVGHTELYETNYHTQSGLIKTDCDYYCFDIRYGIDEKQEGQIARLLERGYVEHFREDGAILILAKAAPNTP